MKKYFKQKNKGFSSVELVVYLGIFAFISVFLINSILLILKSFNNFTIQRNINNSAVASMERMTSEIRQAGTVNAGSVLGTNPGMLVLDSTDRITGVVTVITFSVSDGQLFIQEGSQVPQALTSSSVEVTNLVFRKITTANSSAIKIEMSLRGTRGEYEKVDNFYNTAVLRMGY